MMLTEGGMSIRFPLATVPVQGRVASGVKGMGLENGDAVRWLCQLEADDEIILFSERGWAKRIPQSGFEAQNRAGKGVRCFYFNKNGSNGRGLAGIVKVPANDPCDLLIWQARSPMSRLSRNEVLLQGRSGKGMPYVMAILDDVVTGVRAVAPAEEPAAPDQ